MIPFPLPPALARLHDLLEAYTEHHEKGFFLAEQDRNNQARGQPVLMFVTPIQLSAIKTEGEQVPGWMGEVPAPDADDARLVTYAKYGIPEFWRVRGVEDGEPRIEVHTEPQRESGTYGQCRVFAADEQVESATFTNLVLKPRDLLASSEPEPEGG